MDSHRGPRSIPIIDARSKLDSHKASVDEQEFALIKERGFLTEAQLEEARLLAFEASFIS